VWWHECKSSCLVLHLQSAEYLERWPATFNEAGRSVGITDNKGTYNPEIELNTVHLRTITALFTVYAQSTPAHLMWGLLQLCASCPIPVLTQVRAPSILEKHPRYVLHRDRAGYNTVNRRTYNAVVLLEYVILVGNRVGLVKYRMLFHKITLLIQAQSV